MNSHALTIQSLTLIVISLSHYAQVLCSPPQQAGANSDSQFIPSVSLQASCPRLRIALINGVPFHYELLVGLLHVLQPYEQQLDVFLHPSVQTSNPDGAWAFIRWSRATFYNAGTPPHAAEGCYALAILVSPDYELDANLAWVAAVQPHSVVAIVHNSDFSRLTQLVRLQGTHALHLLTLSPHVARSLANATQRHVEPILPIYPFTPSAKACMQQPLSQLIGACLHGFAIQGKFSNLRRNYSGIWSQMQAHAAELDSAHVSKLFKLHVLGKGANRLALPAELEQHVTLHRRLPYQRYYDIISHTLALLPALASARYYTDKFSSTIVMSLSTGTPMIVNRAFLRAYSMFSAEEVYLAQQTVAAPGAVAAAGTGPAAVATREDSNDGIGSGSDGGEEGEVDVMLRLLHTHPAQVHAVRVALARLRARLNQRAFTYFNGLVTGLCKLQGH